MPDNVSIERRQLLEIFGAEVVSSPGEEGSNGAIRLAEKLAADDPTLRFLFQYGNPANPLAHYEGTGPEIWRDCPEVDVFVAGLGHERHADGRRPLPEGAASPRCRSSRSSRPPGELVQGLRSLDDGFVPPIFDPAVLDRKFIVRPRESIEWVRRLLDECGVFAGISSGAAVAGAVKVAAQLESGTIVTLLPDGGLEVPVVGCVDRRPRRRRRARHPHQLLVAQRSWTITRGRSERGRGASCAAGGLVAFPTETVYGLGCDADEPDALRRLYAVKGRPAEHPVIVHVADESRPRPLARRPSCPDARAAPGRGVLARSADRRRAPRRATSPTR